MEELSISSSLEKISELNQENEVNTFLNRHSDFLAFGPSLRSVIMVNNLLSSSAISLEIKKSQLKQLVFQTFNESFLNEIQIAVWSICLEKFVWNSENDDLWLSLISSALYAKEILGENIEYLLVKFTEKFLNYKSVYNDWKKNKDIDLSVKIINHVYNKLGRTRYMRVNYNYLVDDVIFQYLPYNNPKKLKRQGMMRLNSGSWYCEEEKILPDELYEDDLQPLPLIGRNSDKSVNQSLVDSISHLLNFDV